MRRFIVPMALLTVWPCCCWTGAQEDHSVPVTQVITREIEPSVDHNHCTTRQFQHQTFYHEGIWFAFYSDGADFRYQTSDDWGETWVPAKESVAPAPNGSTSFDLLKIGDTLCVSYVLYPLGRYDVNASYAKDPARRGEYTSEGRIKRGRIEGRVVRWLGDIDLGFTPGYGNLVRDTLGHLWILSRDASHGLAHHTRAPGDLSQWTEAQVCIPEVGRHAMDAAALNAGKLYVASILTTEGKLYGNLYDGRRWGSQSVLMADDVTTVAGDDRRLSLEFDPVSERLHLTYIDAGSTLRYRWLGPPYGPDEWRPPLSEPGRELAAHAFTCALSLDTRRQPAGLLITYGSEKHVGADERERTGELYVRRFHGEAWDEEAALVSQPGTIHNWYPNVNQDAGAGLCVMYSRSVDPAHLGIPLAVMVSTCRLGDD